MAAAAAQPTPTPQTHCFICPPHTQAVHCWTAPVVCDTMQMPTPATHCFICPPHTQNCTPATICTLHGHCPPQHSVPPTLCAVPQTLPCTMLCQADPRAAAAPPAMALRHTAGIVCTLLNCPLDGMVPTVWCSWVGCAPHQAPQAQAAPQLAAFQPTPSAVTHCLICQPQQTAFGPCTELCFTPFHGCPPIQHTWICNMAQTAVTVCVTDCQPPGNQMMKAAVGVNPMDPTPATRCFFCDPPMAAAAMQPTPTVQTHFFICPPHTPGTLRTSWFECHTNMAGCTVHICAQAAQQAHPPQQTLATICTQIGCPTHQIHCYTQPVVCNLQPTQPVVCGVLPPSFGCTQHGCAPGAAAAPQAQAGAFEGATVICSQPARCTQACMPQAQHGGGVTAATVCTMPQACPPHTVHNCPPNTVNTPCATFVCPTLGVCPTVAACTPNGVFTPFGR
jgi:hypothetical protein